MIGVRVGADVVVRVVMRGAHLAGTTGSREAGRVPPSPLLCRSEGRAARDEGAEDEPDRAARGCGADRSGYRLARRGEGPAKIDAFFPLARWQGDRGVPDVLSHGEEIDGAGRTWRTDTPIRTDRYV